MRAHEFILEAPITDLELLGKFDRPGSMTVRGGRHMVSNPAYIERATHAFRNTPFNFRIFISNVPGSARGKSQAEPGVFGISGIENKLYERGILGKDGEDVRQLLGSIFKKPDVDRILANTDSAITVIYAGNLGSELVPLTPWMLAHRLGHAIQASSHRHTNWHTEVVNYFWETVNYMLREYYSVKVTQTRQSNLNIEDMSRDRSIRSLYLSLFNQIGTMRSTGDRNITRPYEFLYECFAQYLISGSVKFNPLPLTLTYGSYAWGRPRNHLRLREVYRGEYDRDLGDFAGDMNDHFTECLRNLQGNILSI